MNKKVIQSTSVLHRDPNMLFSKMDQEVVMLSISNSEYYGLDEIGSRIWEILEKPVRVDQLIDRLLEEYEVSRTQCENDVFPLLNELYDKKLIHLVYE